MFLLLSILTFSMSAMVHSESVNEVISDDKDFRLSSIIGCFQDKFIDKCLRVKAIGAAKLWSSSVVATARDNKDLYQEDPREVGNLAQEIGELITYGISRFFHSEETDYPGDHTVDKVLNKTGRPDGIDEGKTGLYSCGPDY